MKSERDRGVDIPNSDEVDMKSVAVTDEEMVERYGTLIQTVGKKFSRKRKSHPLDKQETEEASGSDNRTKLSKRKFLRPDS